MFQVRVDGIPYVGIGNSTNKKDSQTNAAYDFANYLVRVGKLAAGELPMKAVSHTHNNFFTCGQVTANKLL